MALNGDTGTDDPLARAVAIAKEEPFEGSPQRWSELSEGIMSRVRTMVRPGEPLLVHPRTAPHLAPGSDTWLAGRVVSEALRRHLTAPGHAPARIELEVSDGILTSLEVDLVASYGEPLLPLGDRLREELVEVLRELIGPAPGLDVSLVTVTFTDVVDGAADLL
jgi:hypothetical protein